MWIFAISSGSVGASAREGGGEETQDLPPEIAVPGVSADSWIITDAKSGEELSGENESRRLAMASTTKIMTALITLQRADLDEEATVSRNAASFARPEYSNAGLLQGDTLTVRELLKAALIVSGNDAATALAEHVGGEAGKPGVERFVEMMNEEAGRLGLEETHFENPTGLDAKDHRTSARDLAKLARVAMSYPEFRETIATEYAVVTTQDREIPLTNINELLYSYPPANGVKTGTSPAAGPSLVASAAADDEWYIAVVLDAPDRYGSATGLLDYGFSAYDRRPLVQKGERYDKEQVPYRRDESVALVAADDVSGLVGAGSEVKTEVSVPDELPDSARKGDRVGEVVLEIDGRRVGESDLVAAAGYEEAPVWRRLWYGVSGLWR